MAYNVCIKPMNINKRRDKRTDDWMVKNRACRGWWLPLALFFFVILHYQEPITWHYLKISYQQRYERRRHTPKKGFYHLCSIFTWSKKKWREGLESGRNLPLPPLPPSILFVRQYFEKFRRSTDRACCVLYMVKEPLKSFLKTILFVCCHSNLSLAKSFSLQNRLICLPTALYAFHNYENDT